MLKIVKLAFSFVALSLLSFSFLIPAHAESIYAYITADPIVTEMGKTSTLTVTGFLYGSGTYDISVEFWDSDKYEDIVTADDQVGSCKTSVTTKFAGTFTCTFNVVASDFMKGNIDEEADWVEYYAIVTTKDMSYNTGNALVYCSWCSGQELAPK